MKSKIGYEHSKLKPYLNMMSLEDRKLIVNAKMRSILDYGLPLYMGETEGLRNRLEACYMTLNRIIHGGVTFKISKVNICKKIKCDLPSKHILKTSARFIQKHIYLKKCPAILDKLVIPKREASIIYMRSPQMGTYPASLDKLIQLYNSLPLTHKSMKPKGTKDTLRKMTLTQIQGTHKSYSKFSITESLLYTLRKVIQSLGSPQSFIAIPNLA